MYTIYSRASKVYLSHFRFHENTVLEVEWNAAILNPIGYNDRDWTLEKCFLFRTKEEALGCIEMLSRYYQDNECDYKILRLSPKTVYDIIYE